MMLDLNDNNHVNDDEPIVNPSGFFNELSQNACSVRVAVRVRPLIGREFNENMGAYGQPRTCVDVGQDENKLQIGEKQYQFDRVFSAEDSQQEIFDVCARNLVLGCFAGYNATIIAYGQTGSGKTHTMGTGATNGLDELNIGIVPRVFQLIFEELDRKRKQSSLSEFTIKISFLELYNEELHDLLDIGVIDRITGKPTKELQIKEKNGSIMVHGLKEETVQSTEDCIELLNKGISHRTTSATLMNEGSSRSHAIFTIAIEQKIVKEIDVPEGAADAKGDLPGQQEEQITAKFHFVDLAGSERLKRTGAVGKLMQEGISINKGLLCLGNVISALTDENKKDKHIPYRDSKLTRILQDSLGGNSRTTMIACVSPAESNYEESLNSIKYASRARNIKNKAVVNRDPNSLLIDSLRQQITKCQGEILAYQQLIKDSGVTIPADFSESVQRKVDEQRKSPSRPANFDGGDSPSKPLNSQEVNQFKIQLSKKEEKLKDLTTQLSSLTDKLILRNTQLEELQKERDHLKFKNEILTEHCQRNNITVEMPSDGTLSLIDEYKSKIDELKKSLDLKVKDNNERQAKIEEMIKSKAKDDKLLQQYNEEIQRLKSAIKRQDSNSTNAPQLRAQQQMARNFKLSLRNVNPEKPAGEMPNFVFDAQDINKKIIDSMTSQLDSLFSTHTDDTDPQQQTRSPQRSKTPVKPESQDEDPNQLVKPFAPSQSEEEPNDTKLMEEKQKILSIAMEGFQKLQSEYEEMAKHRYQEQVKNTETVMRNMDNEKQATLKKTTDSKQIQVIEQQHKAKMDELAKQLVTFKEKEKQQEMMAKQISMRESKIKNLEDDIGKWRKNTENLEKKLRTEQDKISEYKISTQKEISLTKKNLSDKEKEVLKLKEDLVKRDQVMYTKLEEMKLQQKRQYEERLKRELDKGEEESKYGMDIDRIKVWIQSNTDRMLRQRDLQDLGDQHIQDMELIEIEMEEQADRLTQLTIERDRKVIEMEELVAIAEASEEPDEGPILELEEDLYKLSVEIERVEELLQTQEEKYNLLIKNNDEAFKESAELGFKSIEPLKFSGLKSIESAKLTLEVFFDQLLNLNFQKRDLEKQCITQDESVIELTSKVSAMQTQIIELSTKLQNQHFNLKPSSNVPQEAAPQQSAADRVAQASKEKALKTIINTMEGYVEYDNVKNLGLKPNEMNSLTKLSLSKIVSNHKQQLEEEKKRNHNLVLKLEAALSEKDQIKLKYDNLKKKTKDEAYFKDTFAQQTANSAVQSQQQSNDFKTQNGDKFQSYAAARATRRGTNQPTSNNNNKLQNDIEKAKELLQSTPGNQGKYKSRIGGTRGNDESEAAAKRFNKHPSTIVNSNKKPLFNLGNNNSSAKKQSRSNSRELEAPKQMPSFMNRTKASANQVVVKKFNQPAPSLKPRQVPQVPSFTPDEPVQILDDQAPYQKPHMNLQDRRNQRKMISTQEGIADRQMNEEIDKIKETTQMITTGQQHYQRQQSRAREYSKKIQNERSNTRFNQSGVQNSSGSFDMGNLKGLQEDDNEESPRNNIMMSQGEEEEQYYAEQQVVQPWIYEELAQLMNNESRMIGCQVINGRIVLVFENFVVREIDLFTFEERNPINLLQINGLKDLEETAVDVAVDKELEAIAIATPMFVYIFDFTYQYQAKIQAESIERVLFCQYHIVVMVNAGDSSYFICYQIEDQSEVGCFEIQTGGQKTIMKTDNNFIYLSSGIQLVKLSVPDLQRVFLYESEHEAPIIDMTVTSQNIVTTSEDKSVRVHQIDSGEQSMNSLDNVDCDHLDSCEDFIFTRLQDGASIAVFRYYDGAQDLNFVNEIDLQEFKDQVGQVIDFKMQGNILTKLSSDPQAPSYQIILLVTVIADLIIVNALKYKPLSEI